MNGLYKKSFVNKTQKIFVSMLISCLEKEKLTCLFFAPYNKISELYKYIPEFIIDEISINRSTQTILFDNGSKILIRKPNAHIEKFKGIKIDFFEEFGLMSEDVYNELKVIGRKYESTENINGDKGDCK